MAKLKIVSKNMQFQPKRTVPDVRRHLRMFFVAGVYPKSYTYEYNRAEICSSCGKYGRYMVQGHCNVFSFFFIPLFKWGWRYTVTKSCCGQVCMLDKDLGDRLRRGEDVVITERDLDCGHAHTAGYTVCPSCGANVDPQHNFCPNCGQKL